MVNVFITIAAINPEAGGPSRSVPSLARHLSMQEGFNVNLLALDPPTTISPIADKLNYSLNYFPFKGSQFSRLMATFRMRNALACQVRAHVGSSIIHDQGIWLLNNHAAIDVAKKTSTPIVVSLRGMIEPWAMNHKRFKKKIAWSLYQKRDLNCVDLIHATSEQEAQNAMNLGLQKHIAIIPNGVEIPQWRDRRVSLDGKKTILFLSRIHPKKGLINLVSAWRQVKEPDWKIVVVGPDEAGHQQEVISAISAAGLQNSFEIIGPIDDDAKWEWYFNADIFVLPSFSENFGIVIAESLACGLPVITTTGTPWQELNTHKCGWWIDVGVEPLVGALREAIALSDAEREAMGVRGRQLVQDSYSWSKIGSDMASVYEWVLAGGSPPSCVMTA